MVTLSIGTAASSRDVLAAAQIWAEAVARREGLADPVPAAEKVPGLTAALANPGATMHLATDSGRAVGFLILVPSQRALEIRYLGVSPSAWGQGVGTQLLAYTLSYARAAGHELAELWVLIDNERAIEVYRRAGWQQTPDRKCQLDTRRIECRLEHPLTESAAGTAQ